MRNLISILISGCICLLCAGSSDARTITVDNDAPADFTTIQAAINDANNGDTVEIRPGTYTGEGNRDIDFLAKAITVRSKDPNDPNIVAQTIIDCNGTEENPHRGFNFISREEPNSVLSGVTITNGFGPPADAYNSCGGAVLCESSRPSISDCRFLYNSALKWGGAVSLFDASPILTRCEFARNTADSGESSGGVGGAVSCRGGEAKISKCLFVNNLARGTGGAIHESGNARSIVTDCAFRGNSVKKHGGGAIAVYGSMVLTNCTFSLNSDAPDEGAVHGGAVYCYGKRNAAITGCTFTENRGWLGGAIFCDHDNTLIGNCRIEGNSATYVSDDYERGGGGIMCDHSEAVIRNCIVNHNSAQYGGGIFLRVTDNRLEHCTITNNSADRDGDGVYCYSSTPTITNSIIRGNSGSGGTDIAYGNAPLISYSNIEGGSSGAGNMDADPLWVNPGEGDYHLSAGSPCRDKGDPLVINLASGNFDIDGEPRVMGPRTDMGADEFTDSVLEIPIMGLSSTEFLFTAIEATSAALRQTLTVRNDGLGTLNWQIDHDCSWLRIDPNAGQAAGEPSEVTLLVDTSVLSWGSYQCEAAINAESAVNGNRIITVTVQIRRETPIYVPGEFESIQQAIDASVPGDTIIVSPGTYEENIDFLGKNLKLTSIDPNDPGIVAATVITGNGTAPTVKFRGGEDETCRIDGFTITSKKAKSGEQPGGGISADGAAACITNCIVTGNRSDFIGGGIHGCNGPITNCTISYNTSGTLTASGVGGGLADCHGAITDCNIVGNSAGGNGGGLYNCDGPITNCNISGNYAGHPMSESNGGGLYDCEGEIRNCTVMNNTAMDSGGGFANCDTINYSTITGNSAGIDGGGVSNCVAIANCLIARNSAEANGGGVCNFEWLAANCTITGNNAGEKGGAIYSGWSPTVSNCILWNNAAPDGEEIYSGSYFRSARGGYYPQVRIEFSNVQGGLAAVSAPEDISGWGVGNIDVDPCFADPETNDYHLKSKGWRWDDDPGRWTYDDVTSRCIDAGDPDAPLADELVSVPLDPNGYWARNIRINMGAYGGTAQASIAPHAWANNGDYNNDGLSNFIDFALRTDADNPANPRTWIPADLSTLASFADSWLECTTWAVLPLKPGAASDPNPSDGAGGIGLDPVLSWQPGEGAASHNVYFGAKFPLVLRSSQSQPSFQCNLLDMDSTYFWRIDEVNPYGITVGEVWSFTTCAAPPSGPATDPYPEDTETGVPTNIVLTWSADNEGISQRVYFGVSNPPEFRSEQSETEFYPGILSSYETYYWRIDLVNGCGTITGPVWSFTTRGIR